MEPIVANLVGPLKSRLQHSIDLLVFNPPYVPTYDSEAENAQEDRGIAGAWAGGTDGMQITDILLEQLDVCISILVCMLSSGPKFFNVGPIVPPGSLLPRGSETERHTRNSKADVRSFQIPKRRKTLFTPNGLKADVATQIVLQRRAGREHLFILRFKR